MGDLDVLTVTLALAGMVVLYGAIKNKNPLDVIKLTLQGKPLDLAGPLAVPGAGLVQTVPGTAAPDPSEFHSDGTPRAWPNGTPRYVGDPLPSQLPKNDPRLVFKVIPPAGGPGDPRAPKDARRPIVGLVPFNPGGGGGFV